MQGRMLCHKRTSNRHAGHCGFRPIAVDGRLKQVGDRDRRDADTAGEVLCPIPLQVSRAHSTPTSTAVYRNRGLVMPRTQC